MRLIDADALIEFCAERWIPLNIDAVNMQPTIQPETHWIPCSERLPVPKGHVPYLITEAHYKPEYKGRYVTIDWYDARDPECPPSWDDHGARDGVRVIAWQPLPEPYR